MANPRKIATVPPRPWRSPTRPVLGLLFPFCSHNPQLVLQRDPRLLLSHSSPRAPLGSPLRPAPALRASSVSPTGLLSGSWPQSSPDPSPRGISTTHRPNQIPSLLSHLPWLPTALRIKPELHFSCEVPNLPGSQCPHLETTDHPAQGCRRSTHGGRHAGPNP